MAKNDPLNASTTEFALGLEPMTNDEVFTVTAARESARGHDIHGRDEVLARIALGEEEIERRFPGQLLSPYRRWKKSAIVGAVTEITGDNS
jgi:hypothetical protein